MSDMIDEETARKLAGPHWDQKKFDLVKNENNCISRDLFEKAWKDAQSQQVKSHCRFQTREVLEQNLEGTFHRRELKAPAVAFSSLEGTGFFRRALEEGFMENYFFLSEQFTTQLHPAYCGIGSLTMALNTLLIDPKRKWQGVWRWFDDEMLDCCQLLETIRERGITLGELACVATGNGADTNIHYGPDISIETFRRMVEISCSRCCGSKTVLIASYSRGVMNQTGTGHFSPIGGYHKAQDMVLIMDVARFKYPPHWVPLTLLHEALQAVDPEAGKPRGILELSAASEGTLHKRMLSSASCNSSSSSGSIINTVCASSTTTNCSSLNNKCGTGCGLPSGVEVPLKKQKI